MNSFNPLDEQFQSKLGNMSVQPRADMWNKIQHDLAQREDDKIAFWLRKPLWVGIGTVLVGSVIAVSVWTNRTQNGSPSHSATGSEISRSAAEALAAKNLPERNQRESVDRLSIVTEGNSLGLEKAANSSSRTTNETKSPVANIRQNRNTIPKSSETKSKLTTDFRLEGLPKLASNFTEETILQGDQIEQAATPELNLTEKSKTNDLISEVERLIKDESSLPVQSTLPSIVELPRKANTKRFRLNNNGLCYGDDRPDHHFTTELYLNVGGTLKHLSSKIGNEQAYIQKRQDSETSLVNLGFGGRVSYILKRDFVFKMGLDYYQLNEKFVNKNSSTRIIILIDTIQTDMGPKVVTSTYQENGFTVNRYQNKYKMIDLPFSVGYQLRQKNYLLQMNAGASMNLTFIQEGKIVNSFGTPISIDRFDPNNSNVFKTNIGLSLFGSLQLQVPLSKTNYFFVEPMLRYTLNDITRANYVLSQKLTLIGSQLGIGFKL